MTVTRSAAAAAKRALQTPRTPPRTPKRRRHSLTPLSSQLRSPDASTRRRMSAPIPLPTDNSPSAVGSASRRLRRLSNSLQKVAAALGRRRASPSREVVMMNAGGLEAESEDAEVDINDGGDDEEHEEPDISMDVDSDVSETPTVEYRSRPRSRSRTRTSRRSSASRASLNPNRRRRRIKRWRPEEEVFLVECVEKLGEGKWIHILRAGKDVFDKHRTNVDLKDKWKNLLKRRDREIELARQAREETASHDSTVRFSDMESLPSLSPPRPTRTRQRSRVEDPPVTPPRDEISDDGLSGIEWTEQDTHETNRFVVEEQVAEVGNDQTHEDPATLNIMTDESYPNTVAVSIDLSVCPDVASLKAELATHFWTDDDVPRPRDLYLISIDTRRSLNANDRVAACLEQDGDAFYLLHDP